MDHKSEQLLGAIGFSKKESEAYLGLLKLKEAKTGELCKLTKIPSSHIYSLLDSLIEKGVVSFKYRNNTKVYVANSLESLHEIYTKKQEELAKQKELIQESIKELSIFSHPDLPLSDYKYYQGISGIRGMWYEINELLVPHTEAMVFSSSTKSWERLNAFYIEHHKARAKKNVEVKMILPTDAKSLIQSRKKVGHYKAKFMDITTEAEFSVFEGFMVLQCTGEKEPRGFLIKDKIFADTFRFVFTILWKNAKD